MKKLILSAAIVLGSLTTFAQTEQKPAPTTETNKPAQEQYTEIKAEQLPEAVKNALKTGYPDATITKAYVNESKEYKLEIAIREQQVTLYADEAGNWLKK